MVNNNYVPEKGDLVWLDFNPQAGHEQNGRRPAMVLSQKIYNEKTNLALFCPITSHIKGYPFEVELEKQSINGVVLSDQIKNLDWTKRNCAFIEKSQTQTIDKVVENIKLIIE